MALQNNITASIFDKVSGWTSGPKKPGILYSSEGWISQADAETALTTDVYPAIQTAIESGADVSLIIKTRTVT